MKNDPSPAITMTAATTPSERHADAGAEAVAHAPHPERHHEPACAPGGQMVDRRRTGIAGVDDNVDSSGSTASSAVIASRYRMPGPRWIGGLNSVRGAESHGAQSLRRP